MQGIAESLTRILQKYDIRVANKPVRTLQQLFPSPKYRVPTEKQTNAVYQIRRETQHLELH